MTTSEALFAAARALRETKARQVFGRTGDGRSEACAGHVAIKVLIDTPYENIPAACPKCEWHAYHILVHLNDVHRMSFAAIAEYLETLAVEQIGE